MNGLLGILVCIFILPAIPFVWAGFWTFALIYRLWYGEQYEVLGGGSGELGLGFMISLPIAAVAWVLIIYEIVEHVRISIV